MYTFHLLDDDSSKGLRFQYIRESVTQQESGILPTELARSPS